MSELNVRLNRLFNQRLAALDRKGAALVKRVDEERRQFAAACDRLENVEKEPNIEYAFAGRANYFKNLKSSYTKALRGIIAQAPSRQSAETVYGLYSAELMLLDTFMRKLLETNTEFKHVLAAYGNEMGAFKRHFASLERIRDELKREIDARADDVKEYEETLGCIREIEYLTEDIAGLGAELSAVSRPTAQGGAPDADEISRLQGLVSSKSAEAMRLRSEIAAGRTAIESMVRPLDRAAKKFDYTSGGMVKIGTAAEDPSMLLADGFDIDGFISSVSELCKKMEAGELDVKGRDRAMQAAYEALGGRLKEAVAHVRELSAQETRLGSEIGVIEDALKVLLAARSSRQGLARRAEEITRLREDTMKRRAAKAAELSSLFLKYYKSRVQVAF